MDRFDIALRAMEGLLSGGYGNFAASFIVEKAFAIADEMIKKRYEADNKALGLK